MNQTIQYLNKHTLNDNCLLFPEVQNALTEPNGLLAIGGDLSDSRLVSAYSQGIFPWFSEGEPILWWSPNPRGVLFLDDIYINKTLRKFLAKTPYRVSVNMAFDRVIRQCANAPFRGGDTWIVANMLNAYVELHNQGYAHSIEVWLGDELVGGLYGVAINGYFSGESMFYAKTNASKVALVALADLLKSQGIIFIDCQMTNPFLEDMGCCEISRGDFIVLKQQAINTAVDNNLWQKRLL